jgi:hypothetical protein
MSKYWYRLENFQVSTGEDSPSETHVVLRKLIVVRRTPKGVRLVGGQYGHDNPRFVCLTSRKRFACPTVEEAVESFLARKSGQARVLSAQLRRVERAREIALSGKYHEDPDWGEFTP